MPFCSKHMPFQVKATLFRRFVPTLSLLAGLFLLSGCDDPSNVGQGLLDAQSGDTRVSTMSPDVIDRLDRPDETGGNAGSGAVRALAGTVDDPVLGTMTAHGFIDFVPSSQFESTFTNGSVTWAGLELNLDYRYGDTTGVVQFDLFSIPGNWLSSEVDAGSDIPRGGRIASYEIPVTAGVVTLPLPEAWVDSNDATLRSSTFTDTFHGFGIVPTGGDAIVGFRFSESVLRASAVPGDTVTYAMSKVGTLTDLSATAAPADHVILQDGSAESVFMRFPLRGEVLDESLIHRVIMQLTAVDLSSRYPEGFSRPLPGVLGLEAVSADGQTRLEIAEVAINASGDFVVDNTTLTNVFQSANLGKSVLDRFELYFPPEQSGIGFFAFPQNPGASIEALITATSIN